MRPRSQHSSCAGRHRRFTLIELLVVIGVIAILAGLLLPSLIRARQKASCTSCLSQMRQIGIAFNMYLQDSEEWIPPLYDSRSHRLYTDYMDSYVDTPDIWLCPSGDKTPDRIDTPTGMVLHYGMTLYDYDDVDGDGIDNHLPGPGGSRTREVADPEAVIAFADADPESSPHNIGGAQSGTTEWPLTSLMEERHMKGYNALFLAGHSEWRRNEPNHTEWSARRK
jgi:prepilin-type N-terminal cleavage/methylation domain-containing protein